MTRMILIVTTRNHRGLSHPNLGRRARAADGVPGARTYSNCDQAFRDIFSMLHFFCCGFAREQCITSRFKMDLLMSSALPAGSRWICS